MHDSLTATPSTASTPDPLGHDDDVLTQSETLDEDGLGVDPLEELDESADVLSDPRDVWRPP